MWQLWRSSTDFWDSAFAAANELEQPYLAFAVRNNGGHDPVFEERFHAIIDALTEDPRVARLTFTTLDRAHALLH